MDWETDRHVRNQTNNMVKQVKKFYYTSTITGNRHNGKQLWKPSKLFCHQKLLTVLRGYCRL